VARVWNLRIRSAALTLTPSPSPIGGRGGVYGARQAARKRLRVKSMGGDGGSGTWEPPRQSHCRSFVQKRNNLLRCDEDDRESAFSKLARFGGAPLEFIIPVRVRRFLRGNQFRCHRRCARSKRRPVSLRKRCASGVRRSSSSRRVRRCRCAGRAD